MNKIKIEKYLTLILIINPDSDHSFPNNENKSSPHKLRIKKKGIKKYEYFSFEYHLSIEVMLFYYCGIINLPPENILEKQS